MIKNKRTFDLNALGNLVFDLADQSYPQGSPWSKIQWEEDLKLPHSEYFIYEKNNQIIGFLAVHIVLTEIEVMHIAIDPKYQNQGIAQVLLQHLASFAQAELADSIFLEVRQSNLAAQQAYLKSGFEAIGIRKKYYHAPMEDAILMLKKVR